MESDVSLDRPFSDLRSSHVVDLGGALLRSAQRWAEIPLVLSTGIRAGRVQNRFLVWRTILLPSSAAHSSICDFFVRESWCVGGDVVAWATSDSGSVDLQCRLVTEEWLMGHWPVITGHALAVGTHCRTPAP